MPNDSPSDNPPNEDTPNNPPSDTPSESPVLVKTGSLEIRKIVLKDNDNEKEFNFQIRFPDNKINGIYGDLKFSEGIANFKLKNN